MPNDDVPFTDLFKQGAMIYKDNLFISIGGAALLSYVPALLVVLPACLIAFAVAGGTAMMTKGNQTAAFIAVLPVALISAVIFAAVYNVIRVGWTRITLKLNKGETATFGDFAESMPWFVNFLICCVIIGVATSLGALCLVVPGIFIAVRTAFAPYLVVERNMSAIEAIMKSNELVTGYSWQILGYLVALFVANSVAYNVPILQFVLGPAIMAYFDIVLARIYLMRTGELFEYEDA
ncbi:MAG: hypothetical protein K2X77_12930 [Candidatus Obscuribacterales bacterium]|nr:hypothetical protein [Candidatus Obscuribacterales bacterium]